MKYITALILLFTTLVNSQENSVADLKIQGNKRLKTSFVKKISQIKQGVKLDSALIEADIRLLKRLPSIAHAYYQVFPANAPNQYNVFYNIEENFTIIPSANVYTTNDDEFAYRLGLYEFNLFGQNITFGGFYQKDIFDSYAINFRAPFLFSRKLGLAINYQDLTTLEPVFFDNTTADYRYNNASIEALGLFQINFTNRIELGLNYFTEDYLYQSGATNPEVPQELRVKKLLYKAIYEYNNLNYTYQYVEGFRSIFNFQYVHSTEDEQLPDFLIGWNDFQYFKRLGKKGNWANRLRLGLSTNNDTPFAPFAVDNNLNIRGVGNLIDRGTGAIVLNTEYRHTLYEKNWFVLQGNAFVDAGSWQNPGGDLSDFVDSDNLRIYPGIGLRFIHKSIFNAIFRIDYGYGITPNATNGLVFGIGQYF
ncbi:surface antigen-like variable number repeat protein [Winogradskyella wandonensis]|uniref:Surface antigen-like variable number repeat protein n=1 Tax=Winogradskyella wandonensis TaxID=1442586 RepID=A0A4R1KQX2_9FLAO|nr:POTRA domain-containing protein [Winogradskyella wandonensis]TCK67434.1 surface antigen-like variable number repeat protein [Winogradskyella wandonensis]